MKICIIDYGAGNTANVKNAFERIGTKAVVSSSKMDIKNADSIILPGVGAFGDGMKNLKDLGLIELLREQVMKKEKPFLEYV